MAAFNPSSGSQSTAPTLLDFVSTVPAPLTAVLVGLGPWIAQLRYFAELVSWRTTWDRSWLLLATWWGVCLLSVPILRYVCYENINTTMALTSF
jgi:hypothetical protein